MKKEIEQILEYTAIAPSSHNTQPWAVTIKDNTLNLYADFSRSLRYSDPANRELYISVGAALQNTLYAVTSLGFTYQLDYFPKTDTELIASISVNFSQSGQRDDITLAAMKDRHSNRNIYQDKKIPKELVDSWKELVKDLGVKLNVVEDKEKITKIGKIVSDATLEAMSEKEFRNELSKWVRHNWTRAHDGMPGYGMNFNTPMSFLSPIAIKYFNIGSMQAKMENEWIKSSSLLIIISGGDDVLGWVKTGQAYERVVLDATKKDIRNSTMTAAVEIGQHYNKLMGILGIKERPLLMFRLGYCDKIPKPTPKRLVSEILKNI